MPAQCSRIAGAVGTPDALAVETPDAEPPAGHEIDQADPHQLLEGALAEGGRHVGRGRPRLVGGHQETQPGGEMVVVIEDRGELFVVDNRPIDANVVLAHAAFAPFPGAVLLAMTSSAVAVRPETGGIGALLPAVEARPLGDLDALRDGEPVGETLHQAARFRRMYSRW
jgi:hypothetical protein